MPLTNGFEESVCNININSHIHICTMISDWKPFMFRKHVAAIRAFITRVSLPSKKYLYAEHGHRIEYNLMKFQQALRTEHICECLPFLLNQFSNLWPESSIILIHSGSR